MSAPLKVWWIPQLPGPQFTKRVRSVEDAALLLETFAAYDHFEFANNIKPDHSNTGGLLKHVDGEWIDWESDCGDYDDPVAYVQSYQKPLESVNDR